MLLIAPPYGYRSQSGTHVSLRWTGTDWPTRAEADEIAFLCAMHGAPPYVCTNVSDCMWMSGRYDCFLVLPPERIINELRPDMAEFGVNVIMGQTNREIWDDHSTSRQITYYRAVVEAERLIRKGRDEACAAAGIEPSPNLFAPGGSPVLKMVRETDFGVTPTPGFSMYITMQEARDFFDAEFGPSQGDHNEDKS